jgi:oligoendopeptidase F
MQTEWKLENYFYKSITDKKIKQDLEIFEKKSEKFIKKYKGQIALLEPKKFFIFLEEMDSVSMEAEKVMIYLGLISSLNTQDQKIQKESARVEKIFSESAEKFLFIDKEYKQIGSDILLKRSQEELFKPFKNYLVDVSNTLKYSLDESQEKVCIKLGAASSTNLFEELTSSFFFSIRNQKLLEEQVRTLREDQNREKRLEAFKSLSEVYLTKQNQIVLGNLYSLVCKENIADIELRKYNSVMSPRNVSEELSDETVNFLLKKVADNYSLYHSFLKKKAKFLKLKQLRTHDIFAPFPSKTKEKKFTFEEGWKLYKDTVEKVDPKLAVFSDEMLESGRISVYPKAGKTSGAYAQYTKNIPEFVLLNWSNSTSDVSILAHELGHAFHGSLSKIQSGLVYDTPLTLAETASIFNETLMFETLLQKITDKEEQKRLIYNRLDDIFGTIFRQIAYIRFEKRCHESFQKNEPLTFEDYNKFWLEEMRKLYGDAVKLDDDLIKHNWSCISHIYQSPFYCYTYAFGNIISLNIYQAYKTALDKEEFIKKYHQFLAAGGSDTPENLLNDIFGIKFDANFYKLAFTNIKNLLDKLD